MVGRNSYQVYKAHRKEGKHDGDDLVNIIFVFHNDVI